MLSGAHGAGQAVLRDGLIDPFVEEGRPVDPDAHAVVGAGDECAGAGGRQDDSLSIVLRKPWNSRTAVPTLVWRALKYATRG